MPEGYDKETKELLRGARDSMRAAVQIYNDLNITFKAEIFIVVSVIGWRYLLHAYYRANGIDYICRYRDGKSKTIKGGSPKYWGLRECLNEKRCPLKTELIGNLRDLIETRNEIEHWKTDKIDASSLPKLVDCFNGFNHYIGELFDPKYKVPESINITDSRPTEQQGDFQSKNKPHSDTGTKNLIMDLANSSQGDTQISPASTHRVLISFPNAKRKNRSKRSPSKNARAGRRKRAD